MRSILLGITCLCILLNPIHAKSPVESGNKNWIYDRLELINEGIPIENWDVSKVEDMSSMVNPRSRHL